MTIKGEVVIEVAKDGKTAKVTLRRYDGIWKDFAWGKCEMEFKPGWTFHVELTQDPPKDSNES